MSEQLWEDKYVFATETEAEKKLQELRGGE